MHALRSTNSRIGKSILMAFIIAATLIGPLGCSSAQSGAVAPAELPASEPIASFLLPAPIAADSGLDPTSNLRGESLRLFSAPIIDPVRLETLAERYETRSRTELARRRAAVRAFLCARPPAEQAAAARALDIRRQRQWSRWLNLQNRYEQSLRYRLERDLHADDAIARARFDQLLNARTAVQALQRERQQLVVDSYGRLLAPFLARDPQACSAPPSTANSGPAIEIRERLYLPTYLALYRFLNLLTAEERGALLLSLHSGKSADN